jgi:hypothetical protein
VLFFEKRKQNTSREACHLLSGVFVGVSFPAQGETLHVPSAASPLGKSIY